jgi:hypothetical protein
VTDKEALYLAIGSTMKCAPAAITLFVFGYLTLACNSKNDAALQQEAPARVKSSGIQRDSSVPAPASSAATSTRTEHKAEAVLPLAIANTDARLVRFELASSIVEREPTGIASAFSRATTPRVFAFVEVANKHGQPFDIEVRFEPVAATTRGQGLKLAIPAADRWRTQALMATRKPGTYRAIVSGPDGSELVAREFTVAE